MVLPHKRHRNLDAFRKVRLGKEKNRLTASKYPALIDGNGKSHAYLNADIPTKDKRPIARGGEPVAPLYTAICEVCGKAYSHLLIVNSNLPHVCLCRECEQERFAIEHEDPLRRALRCDGDSDYQACTPCEQAGMAGYRDSDLCDHRGLRQSEQSASIVS